MLFMQVVNKTPCITCIMTSKKQFQKKAQLKGIQGIEGKIADIPYAFSA